MVRRLGPINFCFRSNIQTVANGTNGASLATTAYTNFISAIQSILAVDGPMPTTGGPIYNKDEVLLLSKGQKIQLWTKGSINDAQKWDLDIDNLAEMIIHAMLEGKFKHSEWCIQKDNGPWAACDVYTFTQIEFNPCRYRKIATGFYLKFSYKN